MALFGAGMLLAACQPAPRAAADAMGGRFISDVRRDILLGLTFDQMLGLLVVVGAVLFVVYLATRR